MQERWRQDTRTSTTNGGPPPGNRGGRALLVTVGLLLLSSCGGGSPAHPPTGDNSPTSRPGASVGDGWTTVPPREAGLDPDRLDALTAMLRRYHEWNVHAVLVEHEGRLAYEEYFTGMDEVWGERREWRTFDRDALHDVRSISKSVVSALTGIAISSGAIRSVKDPMVDYLPGLRDLALPEKRAVTLRHALTMTAGLQWDEDIPFTDPRNDELGMTRSRDPLRYIFSKPVMHPPGRAWVYNGGLVQALGGVLEHATGKPFEEYAREAFFEPLGITSWEWRGDLGGMPAVASGLRLRARDVAKIGSLYLHGGRWQGRQVVPEEWVRESSRATFLLPGATTAWGVHRYGYLWWHTCYQTPYGTLDALTALGNGQQRIFVLPQYRMAVTILAGRYYDPSASRLAERILLENILPAIGRPVEDSPACAVND